MELERGCGLLLHPTSLPGRQGVGSLSSEAYRFVDLMFDCGIKYWQILPLGPTGYGYSPYQSYSAFAGNPDMIDLQQLPGIETDIQLDTEMTCKVDFERMKAFKTNFFLRAFHTFQESFDQWADEFMIFCDENKGWLEDYVLFRTIKEKNHFRHWHDWEESLRLRKESALETVRKSFDNRIKFHRFIQFFFHRQWKDLKNYANQKGIQIIGDLPIFVAGDSSDTWSHPENFLLDDRGYPTVVAGVPPDYFSKTGQRWGNPLYDWNTIKTAGYRWWIERLDRLFDQVDIIRIDHFRGFEKYWEIPAGAKTAIHGQWREGPGDNFFKTITTSFKNAKIIAEDLGIITPEVESLRDKFGFPGMKILQFAFGSDSRNPYLPHNYKSNCIVYTGTHDNDTTLGWYESLKQDSATINSTIKHMENYFGHPPDSMPWDFIRLAMQSIASVAIFPVQDILSLGSESRMNFPGKSEGNWQWRLDTLEILLQPMGKIKEMINLYGRD